MFVRTTYQITIRNLPFLCLPQSNDRFANTRKESREGREQCSNINEVDGLQCNIAYHNPSHCDRYKLPGFYFLLNSVGKIAVVARPRVLKWLYNLKTVGLVQLDVAGWYEW
jgi:hypothetical protein